MSRDLRTRLRALRIRAGLTQAELAIATGMQTRGAVSAIERGHRDTTAQVVQRWAEACGAHLEVVDDTTDHVDVTLLPDEQRALVREMVRILPQLNPLLVETLTLQLRSWGAHAKER